MTEDFRPKVTVITENKDVNFNSVEYGWEKPTTPVNEWSTSHKEAVACNSKAMNAIFNAVFMEEFKIISIVEVTHTAWNILQTVQ